MHRRNQAEWAIWQLLDRGNLTSASVPESVVHTIRRLIDIDRQVGADSRAPERWKRQFAFIDEAPQGRGAENSYKLENVGALWLGVQFLALGVPQTETVRFLRALKPELDQAVRRIHDDYAERIGAALLRKTDVAATLRQSEFVPVARQVYVLTATVDYHGVLTSATRRGRSTLSNICLSREDLLEFIETYVSRDKRLVVVEIANAVTSLAYFLARAPEIKRGRTASGY
jgi:hypothetical protein